jgi:hypothetical protein
MPRHPRRGPPTASLKYDRLCGKQNKLLPTDAVSSATVNTASLRCRRAIACPTLLIQMLSTGSMLVTSTNDLLQQK